MKALGQTMSHLNSLKLKGMTLNIDELLTDAEIKKASYLDFFNTLLSAEVDYRIKRRMERNLTAAHLPVRKMIEEFEFGKVQGIGKSQINNLLDCHWLDNRENLLFFGPPGIGKTHLAIALGAHVITRGYRVTFERVTNLIRLLKTAEIQRSSQYRLKKIIKSNLLIIDEIGYTPIEKREANLFFNLISDLYERVSIIITSNKSFESWAEMMGDEVLTTALLDRLLHHARIFNLEGESYRISNQKKGD